MSLAEIAEAAERLSLSPLGIDWHSGHLGENPRAKYDRFDFGLWGEGKEEKQ